MPRINTTVMLEGLDKKLSKALFIMEKLGEELDIDFNEDQSSSAEPVPKESPPRSNDVSDELGEVEWIPVSDLIKVWSASPFGRMLPPSAVWGTQSIITLDREYAVLTPDQANQIIDETSVDDIVWQSEKTDCDNISRYFASRVSVLYGVNSVGVIDSIDEGHSYCAFLMRDEDGIKLRGFEPQTDQWRDDVEPTRGWVTFC